MASSLFSILPFPGAFCERCCPQLRYPLRFLVYPCLLAVLTAGIDTPPRQSPCQEIPNISLEIQWHLCLSQVLGRGLQKPLGRSFWSRLPLCPSLCRGCEPQFQVLSCTYFQTRNDRQGKAGPTKVPHLPSPQSLNPYIQSFEGCLGYRWREASEITRHRACGFCPLVPGHCVGTQAWLICLDALPDTAGSKVLGYLASTSFYIINIAAKDSVVTTAVPVPDAEGHTSCYRQRIWRWVQD